MKKHFPIEDILDVLISFDQAVNPERYLSSEDLTPEDFQDAAMSKAQQLGIEPEFNAAKAKYMALNEDALFEYDKKKFFKEIM